MSEELDVLKIVTQRLNKAGIPYLISGSTAANYYTVPRMTRDIDIVIELAAGEADKFVNLFQKDFYVDKEMVREEISRRGMFNLIHKEYVIKVDFIIRKESDFHHSSFHRRRKILIEESPIWLITAEDLILAKLLWAKDSHSEMQLKDVKNLLATVPDLEEPYINNWVSKLGLSELYKEVTGE